MFTVLIRTIVLYFMVVLVMRLMGKRQIGQLQPFELAIAIMVSELAAIPMQDTRIPIVHSIIAIITLLALEVILTILQLKSEKARAVICGKPSILIMNGEIDMKQLRYNKFNLNDLLEELRLQGYYDFQNIHYAILETSGQLSVIPKTEESPVSKKDMKLKTSQDQLPITLIMDGKVNKHNLKIANKNTSWLLQKLRENKIPSPERVSIAVIDSKNKFVYQLKKGADK